MIDDDKLIENFMNKVSSHEKIQNSDTRYQYSYVDLEIVISNPSEYIIPQCLPACKILWDKNIETFMVSNNEDENLYVLLFNLSEENESFIRSMMQTDSRFIFSDYRNTYGIIVNGKDKIAAEELAFLASMLHFQDTKRFKLAQSYLEEYKTSGGDFEIDEYGHIIRLENPELSNITLEDALRQDGKEELYVENESRIYDSIMYLNWHKRYLQMFGDDLNCSNLNQSKPKF